MTTTKTLEALDFMMMDVHRPLTDEEIEQINPQALVDKSFGAEPNGDSEGASVGELYEEAGPRCPQCFGPMPCTEHTNVEVLNIVTSLDISVTAVLAAAHNAGLKEVVIVGAREDGTEYFGSNVADAASSMYHLQRGIYKLNKVVEGEYEDEGVGPGRTPA